jgi:hypothetical protein
MKAELGNKKGGPKAPLLLLDFSPQSDQMGGVKSHPDQRI